MLYHCNLWYSWWNVHIIFTNSKNIKECYYWIDILTTQWCCSIKVQWMLSHFLSDFTSCIHTKVNDNQWTKVDSRGGDVERIYRTNIMLKRMTIALANQILIPSLLTLVVQTISHWYKSTPLLINSQRNLTTLTNVSFSIGLYKTVDQI